MTSSNSRRSSKSKKASTKLDPSNQIIDVVAEPVASNTTGVLVSKAGSASQGNEGGSKKTPPKMVPGENVAYESSAIGGIALGMIETRGMVPAIEASDAMTKSAEVRLVAREFVGGGYVSVLVRGETGAVNASVRAGADACERVGDGLVAAHIIARPHCEVEPVLTGSGAKRRL